MGSNLMRAPTQKLKTEVSVPMKDFAGKFAVITGGGTGMGRAMAASFARDGHSVVILGRREEMLRACSTRFSTLRTGM